VLRSSLGALTLGSDTALSRFWSALGSAEFDEQHATLTLPAGCTWLGDSRHGRTMYVRRCYPLLFQQLCTQRRAVLLGTPGIGKTMFGLYLLWRRLRERGAPSGRGSVVYQSAEGLCAVLHEGTACMYAQGAHAVTELLLRDDTYYVVDGRRPEQAMCDTLLITSPKRSVWGKWVTQHSAALHYAPVFSRPELLACRACCYQSVSEARVLALYDRWGGSARFVLDQCSEQQQAQLTCELTACLRASNLVTAFSAICAADCGVDDVPHRIVHMMDVSASFTSFTLGFASNYMRDRVLLELAARDAAAVRQFIQAAQPEAYLAALRGHLFEGVALSALAAGWANDSARMRALLPASSAASVPPPEPAAMLKPRPLFMFDSVAQFANEAPAHSLGRPVNLNFPTWDALAIDDGVVTLYQVTVSNPARHGMKAAGLAALDCLIPPVGDVRFVFVVPAERFDSARAAKLPGDAPAWACARLKQYVMTLPEEMLPAATQQACAEAAVASAAVDSCAAGEEDCPGEGNAAGARSRKRRCTSSFLPAGGGSPS
jgi:hypothetical protein